MSDIKYHKGLEWNRKLTTEMLEFEKETGKHAIHNKKVTGQFEYWMYCRKDKKTIKRSVPKKSVSTTRSIEQILGEVEPIVASQYWRRLDKGERKIILETIKYTGKFEYVLSKGYSQLSNNLKHKLVIDDNFNKYTKAIEKYRLKKKKIVKAYKSQELTTNDREQLYYKIESLIEKNNENIYKWHQVLSEINLNRELLFSKELDKKSETPIKKKIRELNEDVEFWANKRDKNNTKIRDLAKKGRFDLKYAKDPSGGAKAYHITGIKPKFYFDPVRTQKNYLSSKESINNTVSTILKDAKNINKVQQILSQFKKKWTSTDYQNIIEAGACHVINVAPIYQLRKNGFNIKSISLTPKNKDILPIHCISIISINNRKYVIDFTLEQFDDYEIPLNIPFNKVVYNITEYNIILKHYRKI